MHGFRLSDLGSDRLSWRDLLVLVRRWQGMAETATATSVHGVRWSVGEQLLALVADALHDGNWQRAGKKSAPRPKRIPRPWEASKAQTIGRDPIPISEFDGWWESRSEK